MAEIQIRPYNQGDEQGIVDVILPIQQEEFGIAITREDQPDLADIAGFYLAGKGAFFVAEVTLDTERRIIGTISIKDIGHDEGALRKMFVAAPYRGRSHGVADGLLAALIDHAQKQRLHRIYLGTTDRFLAAHRFYERHGFLQIDSADLPTAFPRMAVDTRFYARSLD
ncbi:GNAT family N-acetyltransferase [Novosphingobium sp. 9]|uniref:GNAT family N-acetyltransferase n=1 Tax=Novosphingobium sp. 9 TaxID=2025349 RepID=UPI0021B64238|nr:GNAT family N-acetyltransferase [Novosphingobium sp. 9]